MKILPDEFKNFFWMLSGVISSGVGVGLTVVADLGLAPWDVLHQALSERFSLTIGTIILIVSCIIFATWIPLRQKPGIGTVFGVIFVGPIVDFTVFLFPEIPSVESQFIILMLGLLLFSFGVSRIEICFPAKYLNFN